MPEPTIKVEPGVHIGTFASVRTGGKITLDGSTIQLGPNATIGKWFDVSDAGSAVSARNFIVGIPPPALPKAGMLREASVELAIGVVASILAAIIATFYSRLSRMLRGNLVQGRPAG
jgi:hypothetical protein